MAPRSAKGGISLLAAGRPGVGLLHGLAEEPEERGLERGRVLDLRDVPDAFEDGEARLGDELGDLDGLRDRADIVLLAPQEEDGHVEARVRGGIVAEVGPLGREERLEPHAGVAGEPFDDERLLEKPDALVGGGGVVVDEPLEERLRQERVLQGRGHDEVPQGPDGEDAFQESALVVARRVEVERRVHEDDLLEPLRLREDGLHRGAAPERVRHHGRPGEVERVEDARDAPRLVGRPVRAVGGFLRESEGRHVERDGAIAVRGQGIHGLAPEGRPRAGAVHEDDGGAVLRALLLHEDVDVRASDKRARRGRGLAMAQVLARLCLDVERQHDGQQDPDQRQERPRAIPDEPPPRPALHVSTLPEAQ